MTTRKTTTSPQVFSTAREAYQASRECSAEPEARPLDGGWVGLGDETGAGFFVVFDGATLLSSELRWEQLRELLG